MGRFWLGHCRVMDRMGQRQPRGTGINERNERNTKRRGILVARSRLQCYILPPSHVIWPLVGWVLTNTKSHSGERYLVYRQRGLKKRRNFWARKHEQPSHGSLSSHLHPYAVFYPVSIRATGNTSSTCQPINCFDGALHQLALRHDDAYEPIEVAAAIWRAYAHNGCTGELVHTFSMGQY